MRAWPRQKVADKDVVSPTPLLEQMQELAAVANAGIDKDNIGDGLLGFQKFATNTFHGITRVRRATPDNQTLGTADLYSSWNDVPYMTADINTQDCLLQIEAVMKWNAAVPLASADIGRCFCLGIFVDGGLIAVSPPTGTTGYPVAGDAYHSGYVTGVAPVGAGSHNVKIRWMYLVNGSLSADMVLTWQTRQLWVREPQR